MQSEAQSPGRRVIERIIHPVRKVISRQLDYRSGDVAKDYLKHLGVTWDDLRGKEVLDIGAGTAGFAKEAAKRGIRVISVDQDPREFLENYAGGRRPETVPYLEAKAFSLPFPDASFDLVVSHAAFHWSIGTKEDLTRVVNEAKRVLRPGGEFRFSFGALENLRSFGRKFFSPEELTGKGASFFLADEKDPSRKPSEEDAIADALDGMLTEIDPSTMVTMDLTLDPRRKIAMKNFYFLIKKSNVVT